MYKSSALSQPLPLMDTYCLAGLGKIVNVEKSLMLEVLVLFIARNSCTKVSAWSVVRVIEMFGSYLRG